MYLITSKNNQSHKLSKDSYEWWYIDFQFQHLGKQYTLILIVFEGNPFSPYYFKNNVYKYSINLSIFCKSKKIFFYMKDSHNKSSIDNIVEFRSNELHIKCDLNDTNKSLLLNIIMFPLNQLTPSNEKIKFSTLQDKWVINSLGYKVNGNIKINNELIKINTLGYHDHNWGDSIKSLFQDSKYWYWGSAISKDFSITYFNITSNNNKEDCLVIIQNIQTYTFKIIPIKSKYKLSSCLLLFAQKLEFYSEDLILVVENSFYQNFKKFLFSGLIYVRAQATFKITYQNKTYKMNGTTEYAKLSKMNNPIIRFLMKYGFSKPS